jgi:hypothetical protein
VISRFKSIKDNVSFQESIRLKDLSRFFDIACYIKRLDNDSRLCKTMDKWLNIDVKTIEKLYDD